MAFNHMRMTSLVASCRGEESERGKKKAVVLDRVCGELGAFQTDGEVTLGRTKDCLI